MWSMTVLSALELFITRLNTVIIPQKGWGGWKVCVGGAGGAVWERKVIWGSKRGPSQHALAIWAPGAGVRPLMWQKWGYSN